MITHTRNWFSFAEWRDVQHPSVLREATDAKKVIRHLTHLEDLVLTNGLDGAQQAVSFLSGLEQYFAGHADAPVNVSVKIDGAPAIIVGHDPADGKFFVGTKGAFSKTPRIAKSPEDLRTLYGDRASLFAIMSAAFETLQHLTFRNILQGDALFTSEMKRIRTFEGTRYVTFQPNTVMYGVPLNSDLGKQVMAAKFGVCFHTTYTGSSLATLSASSGANIPALGSSPDVVVFSSRFQDLSGTVTFTQAESDSLTDAIKTLRTQTDALSSNEMLSAFASFPLLQSEFMVFQNSLVRSGESITLTPKTFVSRFTDFLTQRAQKEAEKKTTATGKDASRTKFEKLATVVRQYESDLVSILAWQQLVIRTKTFLLKKLNTPGSVRTFYSDTTGLLAGPHEGFVAADRVGNFVKLVDRAYFSRLNFSQGRFATPD